MTVADFHSPGPERRFFHRYRRELAVALVYVIVLIALAIVHPSFFRDQFAQGWVQSAPMVVLAVGMTLVIIARHVDISIGSQFSVCAVLGALAVKAGLSTPMAALLVMGIGASFGAINGILVAFARLPSIVVTLATMFIARESLRWIREGEPVQNLPARFQWFGLSQQGGETALMLIALVVFLAFAIACHWLSGGRAIYATGSDEEAARLAGLRPRRVVMAVFMIMGTLAGLAAMMGAVQQPQVDVNTGFGKELSAIAAVVVGGTAVAGGRGLLAGTLIGVALLAVIGPALLFLHVSPYWELAIQGAIILAAVASDGLERRKA